MILTVMRRSMPLLTAVIAIVVIAHSTFSKEEIRKDPIYFFSLAPVDPRSLMQGDYMELEYAFQNDFPDKAPQRGWIIFSADEKNIATVLRAEETQDSLKPDEKSIRYFTHSSKPLIGAESYFFQEGQAEAFEKAKYAGIRVSASGDKLLEALYTQELKRLPE